MQKQKTREDWFNSLPPEIKEKANLNYKKQNIIMNYKIKHSSLASCLVCSFLFNETPEGESFWMNTIIKNEKLC